MTDSMDFLVEFWSRMIDMSSSMPVVDGVSLMDVIIGAFIIVVVIVIVFANRGGIR